MGLGLRKDFDRRRPVPWPSQRTRLMLRPRMIANGIRRVVQKADSKVWCLWEMTRQGSLDSKAGMAMTMVEQMG